MQNFTTNPKFLEILIYPNEFIKELIPFIKKVFQEYPPVSELPLGASNDIRLFFIRLLAKLNYSNFDFEENLEFIDLIYELLVKENIFNRYLTLKILFPLLNSNLKIEPIRHLEFINIFLINELKFIGLTDLQRSELAFFNTSEIIQYLKRFQMKFKISPGHYESILHTVTHFLKVFLDPSNNLDSYRANKKVICEYCSFAVNLLEFTSLFQEIQHPIFNIAFDLSTSLINLCPLDCYFLRYSSLKAMVESMYYRPDIFIGIERYFLRISFNLTDYDPLKISILTALSDILMIYGQCKDITKFNTIKPKIRSISHSFQLNKHIFTEFFKRITEFLPSSRNLPLIFSCISAFRTNLEYFRNLSIDPLEQQAFILKNLKSSYNIYKILHLEETIEFNDKITPVTFESTILNLMEYIKLIVKSLSGLRLKKVLEVEEMSILAELFLFPINEYYKIETESQKITQTMILNPDENNNKNQINNEEIILHINNKPFNYDNNEMNIPFSVKSDIPQQLKRIEDSETREYLKIFLDLPTEELEYLITISADSLINKYYRRVNVW
ncbi:MAG: hypothetical protein KC414_15165, partial [Romboutsia sp.]|nr:hypothetical protein [Romboutsia sp.]